MTSRRLPENDIANICVLSVDEQYKRLNAKRAFVPPHSLETTRRNIAPLFGVKNPMFDTGPVSQKDALDGIRKGIKRKKDLVPNLRRAEAILDFRDSCVSDAVNSPMRSHRVTVDNSINLTHSLALVLDNSPIIPFVDLRKSGQLSSRARDFIFAMNFHMLVDAMEEYREFGLGILNYWEKSEYEKGLTPYLFSGKPLYSYEDLTDMIAKTYSIWLEILEERKAQSSEFDEGPLFRQG